MQNQLFDPHTICVSTMKINNILKQKVSKYELMLIENCFNNKLIIGIFQFFQKMKTSQIKKFMTLQTKPIKLKFENIKNQEPILKFSAQDIPNINYLYTTIEDTLKNGYAVQQDTLRLIHSVIKRVKKMVDEMDADNNKIRFRVVKSAKKSNTEVPNPKIIQPSCQHNKSTITFPILSLSENRAQSTQLVQNKQNTHYISNNSISIKENKSSTFSSSYSRQVKLKKFDPKPIEISELAEIKAITQQQVNLKLRAEARKLLEEVENKKKMNGILNDKIKELQEQVSLLNKKVENQELFKIDFKFSLKFIEEKELNKQRGQSSSVKLENFQQKNEKKERYIEQYLNQLSLMIVSQNKQIEALHKKIAERERELGKKSSRWTSY